MKLRILLAVLLLSLSQLSYADTCTDPVYMTPYTCYYMNVTATAGGKVTSSPFGISCTTGGSSCSSSYSGGPITLTAAAQSGYSFTGWSGDCTGTGACTLAMSTDRNVTASFAASSGSGGTPTIVPQTGFWYNPNEGGRGYVIEVHSDGNLFIGGFMYDANGNAIWYASGPGAMNGSTYTGDWQQYGHGQTLTGSYEPSSVVNPAVGTMSITFLSTTAGTLTFPDGHQISIVRFPF